MYCILQSLRKIPYFHLITWCGNFVETTFSAIGPKLCRNWCVSQNFKTKKLGEIKILNAVNAEHLIT